MTETLITIEKRLRQISKIDPVSAFLIPTERNSTTDLCDSELGASP